MFCIKCGTEMPDDATACPACGAATPADTQRRRKPAPAQGGQRVSNPAKRIPQGNNGANASWQGNYDAQENYGRTAYTANARPAPAPNTGGAIASLVLGILAILCVISAVASIIGVILAILGWIIGAGAKKTLPRGQTGMATAGIVCSIVALVICVIPLLLGGGALLTLLGLAAI